MKYKLINTNTKEEHLCDKVTIDGFDYYASKETPVENDLVYNGEFIVKWTKDDVEDCLYNPGAENYKGCKKVIATTNPNIDIPKVVDKINEVALQAYPIYPFYDGDELCDTDTNSELRKGFISGYNKSQETHPFSEEDMVEFAVFYQKHQGRSLEYWGKDLFKIWKEQKPKIVYYE